MPITKSDTLVTRSIVLIVIDGDSDNIKNEYDFVPGFSTEDNIIVGCNDGESVLRIFYTAHDFLSINDTSLADTITQIMQQVDGVGDGCSRIALHLQSYGISDMCSIRGIAIQEQFDRVNAMLLDI